MGGAAGMAKTSSVVRAAVSSGRSRATGGSSGSSMGGCSWESGVASDWLASAEGGAVISSMASSPGCWP